MRALRWVLAALVLAMAVPAAGQAPAGLSPAERQQGARAREEILRQFGGELKGPLADYVRHVARRVVVETDPRVRAEDYQLTLLDTPIPNALATPGGYLYVTRGLLALMNSEAELASVLGHEAGHVAARHAARQQTRATLAAILGAAATVVTGSDLVGLGAQILGGGVLASYSRRQEFEADSLGFRYTLAAGYDPWATPAMLAALDRQPLVEGKATTERYAAASWFSTHPVTAERVARAERMARDTGIPPGTRETGRDRFLAAIDGLVWGDSPEQGIVEGQRFRHGRIGLEFTAPPGFRLLNGDAAVVGRGPDGSVFQFTGARLGPGRDLDDVAVEAWRSLLQGQVPRYERLTTRVNGIDTLVTRARLMGRQGPVDVGVAVYRWAPDEAYLFLTQAAAGRQAAFGSLLASLRRLTKAEAEAALRGKRIRIVTVRPGDTVQSLAERMAFPDNRLTRFLALNGITNRPLVPGEKLKIIVDG
ncbi:MAG: M48 family metalloprotease [Sphingomonadaceae bacterium]|uniref:M48 family metalloprotease n=1 Tax=Thermaurantiacus sp. TaxID=2820283 RepID=UPI00298F2B61|nr:M48 family metalloprotease [Thermaurantiacus sp.]MCS6987375.1 M48 family metalloprotease [Sphingomonadaceae bacterium]MDW8415293.1 M48 family metalloprotease [Thermaurantiacus sp.]